MTSDHWFHDFFPLEVAVLKLAVATRKTLLDKARVLAATVHGARADVREPAMLLGFIENFVASNFPKLTREEFQAMFRLDDIRKSRIFREVYEEAEAKGKQKGKREGKREEKLETIARLYAKGRPIDEICDLLEVNEELVRKAIASKSRDS